MHAMHIPPPVPLTLLGLVTLTPVGGADSECKILKLQVKGLIASQVVRMIGLLLVFASQK